MADADKIEAGGQPAPDAASRSEPRKRATVSPPKAAATKKNGRKETEAAGDRKPKPAGPRPKAAYDPWNVLLYPHLTEKSMVLVERENKLVFAVQRGATKQDVADAVEKGFGVRVDSVNIELTRKGMKKAYVRLSEKHPAGELATRLGMM